MAIPRPTPTDDLSTETSDAQRETENSINSLFNPTSPEDQPPSYVLQKSAHLAWAAKLFMNGFPGRYVSQDASQPWLLFWLLQTFQTLGVAIDVDPKNPVTARRAIKTIMANQHPDGGFGGGPMQNHHIIPTYASICSLAIVGYPGEGGGWDQIDRKKMYDWFMALKQPDGSFIVSEHMEVDMRGIYCLLTVATLLDIVTPELVRGTAEYISSCQTYEGGFAASSQPYFSTLPPTPQTLLQSPRPPLGEAHGGYTFCAVASLLLLRPLLPHDPLHHPQVEIDVRNLLRWSAMMQGNEIEGGGFRGRTNKLVDGCYSWWVGGLFALVSEMMGEVEGVEDVPESKGEEDAKDGEWVDHDDILLNNEWLQKFILVSSQAPQGGLRDKPGKPADAYHTLYNLSGLSAAQHKVHRNRKETEKLRSTWVSSTRSVSLGEDEKDVEQLRKDVYSFAASWIEEEGASTYVGGANNRVNATHPIFDLTVTSTRNIMNHFYGQAK